MLRIYRFMSSHGLFHHACHTNHILTRMGRRHGQKGMRIRNFLRHVSLTDVFGVNMECGTGMRKRISPLFYKLTTLMWILAQAMGAKQSSGTAIFMGRSL